MNPEEDNIRRREIVLITKSEGGRPDPWAHAEALAKIASLIAIPVVLAIIGWRLQDQLASRSVSKDYVQLSVSILTQKTDIDPDMRRWAVELLKAHSPIKFTATVESQLKAGTLTLPPDRIQQAHEYKLVWYDHLDGRFWEVMRTDVSISDVRNEQFKSWCVPFDESQYIILKKRLIAADEQFKEGANWWVLPPYKLPALNQRWLEIMDDEKWFFYEVEHK
jgi:hypothetical protein